ncbi:HAD family hydrolase [Cellulomonas shaoxiangyii]|uniref:HAD family hydrolase n=2 Tax=Cellulomonas shaoxiangyii TaxID=2566013 RepID=A0A4P7SLK4_9CELL|nr:HAD hydrolase family protein [Cellulomonas shaoxiangyii]QCB95112.1 HAD family hydrolase [Cellulomonas shaoxiangyii]TGY83410.1 HAD family hydrolase [Cellulomonas shaoxiangyii]
MDGSLLDGAKRVHPTFWPLLDALLARGVTVAPASGRAYPTLRRTMGRDDLVYIAENGAHVVRDGVAVAVDGLDLAVARDVVRRVRGAAATLDVGVVLCGERSAYVERTDDAFLAQCTPYYALLETVDDLTAVQDTVLKVAVHDFGDAEAGAGPALASFGDVARVLVSGEHWVDVMSPTADKGTALRAVQAALGVGPEHTMAFGDYLNDVGMLAAADWSFAMANGHPDVRAGARFLAPSNDENGVVRTIASVLRLDVPGL